MPMYRIKTGDMSHHRIEARDEEKAIAKWLDIMAYESLEQAAEECFCKTDEIVAVPMVRV